MHVLFVAALVLVWQNVEGISCPTLHSYVAITSPANLSQTLFSLEALFGPQTITPIPSTALATLNPATNETYACSPLTTNVNGKIVLVWSDSPSRCSYEQKVLNAQNAGAVAVLVGHYTIVSFAMPTGGGGIQQPITIPSRLLHVQDAEMLQNKSATMNIRIEIGCSQFNFSEALCVSTPNVPYESLKLHAFLEGEFQLQNTLMNGHALYKQTGYPAYGVPDMYIFYNTTIPNVTGGGRWMIASIPNEMNLYAECNQQGVVLPSRCTSWKFHCPSFRPLRDCPSPTVSEGACPLQVTSYCISGGPSWINGVYTQESPTTALWLRNATVDPTNTQWGYLEYTRLYDTRTRSSTYGFVIYFEFDYAFCVTPLADPRQCSYWEVWDIDGLFWRLDSAIRVTDLSTGLCNVPVIGNATYAPNAICLLNHQSGHSVVMTTYRRESTDLNNYGVWKGTPNNVTGMAWLAANVSLYMYHGINRSSPWFVSRFRGTESYTNVRGYCQSRTANPQNCRAAWHFFIWVFDLRRFAWVKKFWIDSAHLLTGECPFQHEILCVDVNFGQNFAAYHDAAGPYRQGPVLFGIPSFVHTLSNPNLRYELTYNSTSKAWQLTRDLLGFPPQIIAECVTPNLGNPMICPSWRSNIRGGTIRVSPGDALTCKVQRSPVSPPECHLSVTVANAYTTTFTVANFKRAFALSYMVNVGFVTRITFGPLQSQDMREVRADVLEPCSKMNVTNVPCTEFVKFLPPLPSAVPQPTFTCQGVLSNSGSATSSTGGTSTLQTPDSNVGEVVGIIFTVFAVILVGALVWYAWSNQILCFAPQSTPDDDRLNIDLEDYPVSNGNRTGGYDMDTIVPNERSISSDKRAPDREPSIDVPEEPDSEPEVDALEPEILHTQTQVQPETDSGAVFSSEPVADPFASGDDAAARLEANDDPFADSATPFG